MQTFIDFLINRQTMQQSNTPSDSEKSQEKAKIEQKERVNRNALAQNIYIILLEL